MIRRVSLSQQGNYCDLGKRMGMSRELRAILHVDMDCFFVAVERTLDRGLQGVPVIVGGRPGGRGVVCSASYEARSFGVHSAMPTAVARRLCPNAVFLPTSFSRYREASERVAALLREYTSTLESYMDEAYLDLGLASALAIPALEIARSIKARLHHELGLPCTIGVASNKTVAKVACQKAKPDGLIEVHGGDEADFLAPLPVAALPGVGKKTEAVLLAHSIRTLGDLATMDPASAQRLLGGYGLAIQQRARGIDPSSVHPPGPPSSLSRETTFATDSRDRAFIHKELARLAESVASRLRSRGCRARCVELKVRFADFRTLTRSRSLSQATDSAQVLYSVAATLLEAATLRETLPVRLLGLGASRLQWEQHQLSLFETSALTTVAATSG